MFGWSVSDIVSTLQRAEVQLAARVMTISPRQSPDCLDRAALEREVEQYEQIDEVCRAVAGVLTDWMKTKFSTTPLVVPDRYCETVVYRLRDATRLLIECKRVPQEFKNKKTTIFEELLVSRWHTYAERYWMQRWRQGIYSGGTAMLR